MSFEDTYDNWIDSRTEWKAKVPSSSKEDKFYLVRKLDNGMWMCDCPSILLCKHVKKARWYYQNKVKGNKESKNVGEV